MEDPIKWLNENSTPLKASAYSTHTYLDPNDFAEDIKKGRIPFYKLFRQRQIGGFLIFTAFTKDGQKFKLLTREKEVK